LVRRRFPTIVLVFVAVFAIAAGLASCIPSTSPEDVGQWGPVLDWGFQGKHAVLMHTGKVLMWNTGSSARVWDPISGQFTPAPATFGDLHCAGQATLADGRVIVIGGVVVSPHDGIPVTATFDPSTGTWTRRRDMAAARWYPTATTLADGRVLATSGDAPGDVRITTPEIYDPATDIWTSLPGANRSQVLYPFMYQLPNGKVYEAGTKDSTYYFGVSGSGSLTSGPRAPFSTSGYSESTAMYDGKILRAGGGDPAKTQAAVIDTKAPAPAWHLVESMAYPRRRMNLPILADGTVMAVGGTRTSDNVADAVLQGEIFDPATEQWSTVASMTEARMYHSTALLLPDGRVLTAGGEASGRLHAQIYSPPYLFRGPRPTISSSPEVATYGGSFQVGTPDADRIGTVALIRPSAVTHALDMNQRYVSLSFTAGSGALQVTAPADGGTAPPGYYMLVIEDTSGIPSVAAWVRIG
jgi:hypothetical protein